VICPYARLQAALFDKDSLVIGYHAERGEPRKKGKDRSGAGDCVDCDACVRTCPTGIDIREGLQLECIACGQCIDACNDVMAKVNRPQNLIAYASQRILTERKKKVLRPRLVAYFILICALLTALAVVASGRQGADVTILRGIGSPFVVDEQGVRNQVRLKIENQSAQSAKYSYEVLIGEGEYLRTPAELGVRVISPENPLQVKGQSRETTSLFILSPPAVFKQGRLAIVLRISLPNGAHIDKPYHLLGPTGSAP
jgi:cytochrome c oxidase accessory protein FixG